MSESRIRRITQISRILRVSLFVVAQFIASLSESRIRQIASLFSISDYLCRQNRGLARMARISRIIDFGVGKLSAKRTIFCFTAMPMRKLVVWRCPLALQYCTFLQSPQCLKMSYEIRQ